MLSSQLWSQFLVSWEEEEEEEAEEEEDVTGEEWEEEEEEELHNCAEICLGSHAVIVWY